MSFYFSNYFYFSKSIYKNEVNPSPYLLITCPHSIDILVTGIFFSKPSLSNINCDVLINLNLFLEKLNSQYYLFKNLQLEKNLDIKENIILNPQDKLYIEFSKNKCINYTLNYKYLTV